MSENINPKKMKMIFYTFAALDLIGFVMAFPMIIRFAKAFEVIIEQFFSNWGWSPFLQFTMYLSFGISSLLHLKRTSLSLIIYYLQFVLRFLYFSMSLGFLFYLEKIYYDSTFHYVLAGIAIIGEITRLVLSIRTHINISNSKT